MKIFVIVKMNKLQIMFLKKQFVTLQIITGE